MIKKNNSILMLVPFFYPNIGGLERYVEEVAVRFIQRGYEIHIVTFSNNHKGYEVYKGIHIHRFRFWFMTVGGVGLILNPLSWRRFSQELFRNHNFTYINTHTRIFACSVLGAKLSIKYKVPLIHTEHGAVIMGKNEPYLMRCVVQFIDKRRGRYIIKIAKKVVAISLPGVKFCKDVFRSKNIIYIPNGIDSTYWQPLNTDSPRSTQPKKLLYVGRIVEDKGVQYLLRALGHTNNFCLTIIGEGPFLDQLKVIVKSCGISNKVNFLGSKSSQIIKNILKNTDCFVNPSLAEGLPTTVLEALSMGVPTVATNVGGTADVLSLLPKYSHLVEPSDIISLKLAIEDIIKREAMSSEDKLRCHEVISNQFNWETIVDKLQLIFH
jgi:glycosyltransferase involved in cell wall biosynthesis